jgi:hypothetical protein
VPKFKFIFRSTVGQNEEFIILSKMTDDGRSLVLRLMGRDFVNHLKKSHLLSFGNYAPHVSIKELELTDMQVQYGYRSHMQTQYCAKFIRDASFASEESFSHLLGENILEKLLSDKAFLKKMKKTTDNHPHLIAAVKELERGVCPEFIINPYVNTRCPYRKGVIEDYFKYLLGSKDLSVNAHPEGLFTVIHSGPYFYPIGHAGVNDLNISPQVIATIQSSMESLIRFSFNSLHKSCFNFLGDLVPHAGNGYYLEITHPTLKQINAVDQLFYLAEQNNLFPSHPQDMIFKVWLANCEKIFREKYSSFWMPNSPTLLAKPSDCTKMNEDPMEEHNEKRFDIRFNISA